jgi:hypothetical protein
MEEKKYNSVNHSVRKKDAMQLLLGKPVYVDDITSSDALTVKLLRSPYANAIVEDIDFRMHGLDRYKLYPTENIYNFLQLDTMTGKIEIVQWSLDDDKEGSATLNNEDLSLGTGCGTFELYPTKNIYQFLLLDKVTGRRWHVQWGFESSKRWIKRIY